MTNYVNAFEPIDRQTDEIMISNMLSVLNNSEIYNLLSVDERKVLCQVVKNHIMERAFAIAEVQNKDKTAGHFR